MTKEEISSKEKFKVSVLDIFRKTLEEKKNLLREYWENFWGEEKKEAKEETKDELDDLKQKIERPSLFPVEMPAYWEDITKYDYFQKLTDEEGVGGEFTNEEKQNRRETIKLDDGVSIRLFRDEGMTFYIVKKGDTINGIRHKLSKIPEFSYLNDSAYAHPTKKPNSHRNISSFNILPRHLKPGMYVPIPLEEEKRQINHKQFANYCYEGILEMKADSFYKKEVEVLVNKYGEKSLIAMMIAFARSETSANLKQEIGAYSYQRYEGDHGHREYSFTMFHILMQGPGLRARRRLGLTEGQCYHPKNAAKLFLGYWLEKVCNSYGKFDASKVEPYFKMETKSDFKKAGRRYCGKSSYGKKLEMNYEYAKEQLAGIKIPSDQILVALNTRQNQTVASTTLIPEIKAIPSKKPKTIKPKQVVEPVPEIEAEIIAEEEQEQKLCSIEELEQHLAKINDLKRDIVIQQDSKENLFAKINKKNTETNEMDRLKVNIEEMVLPRQITSPELAVWLSGDPLMTRTVQTLLEAINPEAEASGFNFEKDQVIRVPVKLISVPNAKLEDLVKIWYPNRDPKEAIAFVKKLNGRKIIRVGEVILVPALHGELSQQKQKTEIARQTKEKAKNTESPFYRIGSGGTIKKAIKNANWDLKKETGLDGLRLDADLKIAEGRIQKYIRDIFGKNTYFPTDRVSVGVDRNGIYFRFQRGKHTSEKLRLKSIPRKKIEPNGTERYARKMASVFIGKKGSLEKAIKNANWKIGRPLKTDTQVSGLAKKMQWYVKKTSNGNPKVYSSDTISFIEYKNDKVFAQFQRGNVKSGKFEIK